MSGYHCEYCGKLHPLNSRCDCDTSKAMDQKFIQSIMKPDPELVAWLVARTFGNVTQWLKIKGCTFLWTDDATAATRFADKPSAELVTLDINAEFNIKLEEHIWG